MIRNQDDIHLSSITAKSKSNTINEVDEDDGEDMLLVDRMIGYQSSTSKELVYWCSVIFTLGLSLLFYYWFKLLYIKVRYEKVSELYSATWVLIYAKDSKFEFCKVIQSNTTEKYLIYRYSRFFFESGIGLFEKSKLNNIYEKSNLLALSENGLNNSNLNELANRFGLNEISFPINVPKLFLEEVLSPFFIFQIYSVILWFFEAYYYYAIAIFVIASVSAALSFIEIRSNLLSLQKIAHFKCKVNVIRDHRWEAIDSTDLVPGDIIELRQDLTMPCDVILLSGQAILNESMLTGESIPVTKYSLLSDEEIKYYKSNQGSLIGGEDETKDLSKEKRSLLFGGTLVVKLSPSSATNDKVLGMVRNTAFQTTKGKLILSILYPKKSHFKFFVESLKFIGVLCVLAAIGFVISVWRLKSLGVENSVIIIRALDLITIVIPPALPMAMTVGTGFGLARLKHKKIFCISPPRLNMAGKIQVFCFDKTGTLTEEGLDLLGILTTSTSNVNGAQVFNSMIDPNKKSFKNSEMIFRMLMASCHSLSMINGVVSGDPLEVKIFQSTRAKILDCNGTSTGGQSISIPSNEHIQENLNVNYLENFDFQSKLQRMSVIVQSNGKCMSLVKGSPEMIKGLCLSNSLPSDYDSQLSIYTEKGYRVLASAYRDWDPSVVYSKRELLREQSESQLIFLGFIIMENRIKEQSPSIINTLQKANIRTVMVTGDNPLTATCVAKQCGIIKRDSLLFIGKVDSFNSIVWDQVLPSADEEYEPTNNGDCGINPTTLLLDDDMHVNSNLEVNYNEHRPFLSRDPVSTTNYNLIITGPVFKQIYNNYLATGSEKFVNMLKRGIVYSRMTPDEKQTLVEELQKVGLYVGMCGDGANDCGALKAAHVGISLSESEASIAAPFTSTITDISCCPELIRQGRASLAVSYKLFQFIGMYSMIQFMSVIFLYFKASVLGNWMYLYQDLFVIFPLVIFLGMTKPYHTLSIKRPSGRLISGSIIGSLLIHVLVCISFQTAVYLLVQNESWYNEDPVEGDEDNIFLYLTTSIFIYGSFQYLIMLLTFSFGKPFLKPIYTNKYLSIVYIVTLATTLLLLFAPNETIWKFAQLLIVPVGWRFTLFGLLIGNLFANLFVEFSFSFYKSKRSKKKNINITQIFIKDKRVSNIDTTSSV